MKQEYRHHHHHYHAPPADEQSTDNRGPRIGTYVNASFCPDDYYLLNNHHPFQRHNHPRSNMQDQNDKPTSSPPKDALSASARCLTLEQAYVHDVYSQIARQFGSSSPVRSHIKEFLFEEFEYGSIVLDVGCGDGKYLRINPAIFVIGQERCPDWFGLNAYESNDSSSQRHGMKGMPSSKPITPPIFVPSFAEFLLGDVIHIPFRDESFDGVLCSGVLHHISTTERRIRALRELSRLLKVGGKVLITVCAFEGRELSSQDVLIKWNSCHSSVRKERRENRFHSLQHHHHGLSSSSFESDTSETSTSSQSTTTSAYVNRRPPYESCNSPTAEFGTCYSFVRRALLKFNLSPSTFHYATSSIRNRTRAFSSVNYSSDMPIELSNIDVPNLNSHDLCNRQDRAKMSFASSDFPAPLTSGIELTENFSSLQSSPNRRNSLKEQYGSFVSLIREHILSKAPSTGDKKSPQQEKIESPKSGIGRIFRHRFSLPLVTAAKQLTQTSSEATKESCPEDLVCSHSVTTKAVRPHPRINEVDSRQESMDFKESVERIDDFSSFSKPITSTSTNLTNATISNPRKTFGRTLQKSLSSDSIDSKHSRQQSINTESVATNTTTNNSVSNSGTSTSSHLVAYYSMPELRALERSSSQEDSNTANPSNALRGRKVRPKITDLHPITFLEEVEEVSLPKSREVKRDSSQDTEAAIDEMEMMFQSIENVPGNHPPPTNVFPNNRRVYVTHRGKMQLNLNQRHLHPILSAGDHEDYDCDDEDESIEEGKRTQRSSSVEYKAKISPSYRQSLRRFSASPSTKPLVQFSPPEESQHEPHPSVDSEESFVTIIPANRSCRGSVDVPFEDDESEASFLDDVILDVDAVTSHNNGSRVSMEPSHVEENRRVELTPTNIVIPRNPPNSRIGGEVSASEASNDERTSSQSRDSSATPTASGASTPSPPADLHRYFHLFRCGELEDLITNNVEHLHVVRSYYSGHATSWCVICEKIQVWTI